MSNVWVALGLTFLAGSATGVGSLIAFFAKRTNYRFLSISTGFSAGVMIYISFVEIFAEGLESLEEAYGVTAGHWAMIAAFFGGILLIGLIDNLIPAGVNPHDIHGHKGMEPPEDWDGVGDPTNQPTPVTPATDNGRPEEGPGNSEELMRTGLFTALAIALHNFPEGLVTFLTALQDPALGAAIAVAIALHNIPEGISVSVPIYYATGKRSVAFLYSAISGMAEPIGALIAYGVLRLFVGGDPGFVPPQLMGVLFGGVAGVMVYISFDELLPTSRTYGKGHDSIFGLVIGMAVMAVSLVLME